MGRAICRCRVGLNNFDIVRFEFYRDRDVAFEGFTGKNYLFREEFTSRIWATRYDFPALKDGRVKQEVLPDDTPSGAQGWFINTRRKKFKDPKVREALIYAFDFEWTNKNIMYGSYERTHSVFQNSDLMATGKPGADELALLEPFRGKVPDEVFGEPFVPPVSDGSGQDRNLLRKATQLLQDGRLRDEGRQARDARPASRSRSNSCSRSRRSSRITCLHQESAAARHRCDVAHRRSGAIPRARRRLSISTSACSASAFPPRRAIRCAPIFSSQAAATKGSQNLAGIADPAIDALIDRIIAAPDRPTLVTACKALDRVIRAGRYWVPHWYKASHWIAYWDMFARPPKKPRYARGIPETWWYDARQGGEARDAAS